jgi:hypothetical protein
MGVFFDQRKPDPRFIELMQRALQAPPDDQSDQRAQNLAADFRPLVEPLKAAAKSPAPASAADAEKLASAKAEEVSNQLLGGSSFNTGRFFVALAIFAVLIAAAIYTDAESFKSSPAALFALATTVFGVVVGFLGSEKN